MFTEIISGNQYNKGQLLFKQFSYFLHELIRKNKSKSFPNHKSHFRFCRELQLHIVKKNFRTFPLLPAISQRMPFWNVFYTLDSSSFLWLLKSAKGRASQVALVVKNPPVNAGDIRDMGLIPESGRSPGEGHGNPLQYSCLENPMDREAWCAAVHGVTKSRT